MTLESPSRLEPMHLDQVPTGLLNRVGDVIAAATRLEVALTPDAAASLADVVRVMNCYYSNLIEGHNTRLKDIEAAMHEKLATNEARRFLQLEARSHIHAQQWIDRLKLDDALPEPASVSFICDLHRRFYAGATTSMLRIGQPPRDFIMVPGEMRHRERQDNVVGHHQPPASVVVGKFMQRFEESYRLEERGQSERVLIMAIAHHRLNYIHPFDDGNGRVSRLMSHAIGLRAGIGANGLWSISRGLARGLSTPDEYKRMMDYADMPRQGDLDGRGNLSRRALTEYTQWFLDVCLDQIRFMTALFDFATLSERYDKYVATHPKLGASSAGVLKDILKRGPLQRGEVARVTNLPERTARNITHALVFEGLVGSQTPKGPLSLRFPSHAIAALFPHLYAAPALD